MAYCFHSPTPTHSFILTPPCCSSTLNCSGPRLISFISLWVPYPCCFHQVLCLSIKHPFSHCSPFCFFLPTLAPCPSSLQKHHYLPSLPSAPEGFTLRTIALSAKRAYRKSEGWGGTKQIKQMCALLTVYLFTVCFKTNNRQSGIIK